MTSNSGGQRSRLSRMGWLLLLVGACGGPQKQGAGGAVCFRDDDCEPGMVCVAPVDEPSKRVCSNDPTPLISMVMGPAYGGTGGVAGAATAGAATAGAATAGASPSGGTGQGGAGGTAAASLAGTAGAATAGSATAGSDAGVSGSAGSEMAGGAGP